MKYLDENLTIEERVQHLLSILTIDEKIGLLPSEQQPVERLNIEKRFIGAEFARGCASHEGRECCTILPQPIGMASTFDEQLIAEAGEIVGRESRAFYNVKNKSLFGFGPTVDLERDPRWGRHEEGYGEDPCLTGVMATSYTKAIVGNDKVKRALPLLKHFICNNNETDRSSCNAVVSEKLLNEYYLEAFRKPIVEGGAFGVMGAYNKINGEPGLLSSLNQKYVKDAWDGKMVVSDGHAFAMVMEEHKYTSSNAETIAIALKTGANIMLDAAEMVIEAAKEAVESKLIDEALIDKAISDTLTLRFMLGEFDSDNPYADITMDVVNTEEDKKFTLKMSEKQMVLLENDGILPLKHAKTIAIVGPQAEENFIDWYSGKPTYDITVKQGFEEIYSDAEILCDHGRDIVKIICRDNGKYLKVNDDLSVSVDANRENASEFEKYDWGFGYVNFKDCKSGMMLQDDENVIKCTAKDSFLWFVKTIITPEETKEGIALSSWEKKSICLNDKNELYIDENGVRGLFDLEVVSDGDERCVELAKKADIVIAAVGNHPVQAGREGCDRINTELAPRQSGLIDRITEVNTNTILLIISSYPYAIDDYKNKCRAVVYSSHAGSELGRAVANIFIGNANPGARLASTWYKKDFVFPSIFDYDIEKNKMTYLYMDEEPLYPFGYGMSYSSFEYGNFSIVESDDKNITFMVEIKNVSDVDGDEVIQIYVDKSDSLYSRPRRKMIAFNRVSLKANETKIVKLSADKHLLKCYDETLNSMVLEKGTYRFSLGLNSSNYIKSIEYSL